jgi:hypothetical protein
MEAYLTVETGPLAGDSHTLGFGETFVLAGGARGEPEAGGGGGRAPSHRPRPGRRRVAGRGPGQPRRDPPERRALGPGPADSGPGRRRHRGRGDDPPRGADGRRRGGLASQALSARAGYSCGRVRDLRRAGAGSDGPGGRGHAPQRRAAGGDQGPPRGGRPRLPGPSALLARGAPGGAPQEPLPGRGPGAAGGGRAGLHRDGAHRGTFLGGPSHRLGPPGFGGWPAHRRARGPGPGGRAGGHPSRRQAGQYSPRPRWDRQAD